MPLFTREKSKNVPKSVSQKSLELLKLISSEARMKIVCLLFKHDELCVHEIADSVGLSQSATSHQLAKLEAKNVVDSKRDGQTICYSIKENDSTERLRRIISEC